MLKQLSIRWKLTFVITAVATAVLLLSGLLFYTYDAWSYTAALKKRLETLAQIIGSNSTSALRFGSREDALEVLGSLSSDPSILSAYLFDLQGGVLAEYVRSDQNLAVPLPPTAAGEFVQDETTAEISQPVVGDGQKLGTIVIRSDLLEKEQRNRFLLLGGAGALVLLTLTAVGLAAVMQHYFTDPIYALLRLMRRVGDEQDYGLRAPPYPSEFGALAAGFNSMLAEVESRNEELERYNTELRATNRELDNFAHVVSHDLKSPLVTIEGFVTMLDKHIKSGSEEKIRDSVERIQRASKQMGALIDDLLKLSRVGRRQIEFQEVDLEQVVQDVEFALSAQISAAKAELSVEGGYPRLVAHRTLVTQIIENLVSNAVKYGCPREGCRITVGFEEPPHQVLIYVRDEGPGIAAEHHKRIFALFHRLDASKSGTGLGLAIVAKAVRVLGGRVWVESEVGKGATFQVTLPKRAPTKNEKRL